MERVGVQEFELVQGYDDELSTAATGSGTQVRRGRVLATPGNLFLLVPAVLSAASRLFMVTAAGTGRDPFRQAAALGMVAAAFRLRELMAQMRGY